ncbi:MAG: hypothetical protein Q9166_003870 [cf. Caloplaca sp. 2 TL-2023]
MSVHEHSLPMQPTGISSLGRNERIYQGTDGQGSLLFRQNLKDGHLKLPLRCLIALGLTEVCCREGKGKVLFVSMHERIFRKRASGRNGRQMVAASEGGMWALHRLPKLVYAPFIWGYEDKAMWNSMNHRDRLLLLNARGGNLMQKDLVMPVELLYDPIERERFYPNGLIDKYSGSKAMLAIVPQAFLGWYKELQPDELITYGVEEIEGGYYVADHAALAKHQLDNAEQVIAKLWSMYFSLKPRSVVKYQRIQEGVSELFKHIVYGGLEYHDEKPRPKGAY